MKKYLLLFMISIFSPGWAQHFGQADHPMNKNTDNLSILNYWSQKNSLVNAMYASALKVLSANPSASFFDLSKSGTFQDLAKQNHVTLLGGPMLGNLTENGISIWVRTLKPATIYAEVTGPDFQRRFGPVHSSKATDLSAVLPIHSLLPSTTYTYRLFVDGKPVSDTSTSSFRTAPARNDLTKATRIAFGTCPHRWGLGNQKLFDQIKSRDPDALLIYGDIAVQDRKNHFGMHRADYLLRDMHPAWRSFVASTPVYASWDDHDYFDNDKSGIPEGHTDLDRKQVREVFKYAWNNPSYGLEESREGIFTSSRLGPFDIIMTDNRFFRDKEKKQFLGKAQMDWLKQKLLDCEAPFIILTCGTMWSDYVSNGKDSWGEYDPDGREELFQWIEDNNIKGVLLLSGDRHGARGFRIPRKSGFSFYEFEPASMGARVGPPAVRDSWDTQLFGLDGEFAFGEFTYVPSASDPSVIFRLIKENGTVFYELELKRSQLTPANFRR